MRNCFVARFAGPEWMHYESCMKTVEGNAEVCGGEYEDVRAAFFAQVIAYVQAINSHR